MQLRDWLQLIRIPNVLIAVCAVLLGDWMPDHFVDATGVFRAVLMGLAAAWGNVENDALDWLSDQINRAEKLGSRPVAAGLITPRKAMRIAQGGYFITLLLSVLFLETMHTLWLAGVVILLMLYNRVLQKQPLWGNFAVALLCAQAVFFGSLHIGTESPEAILWTGERIRQQTIILFDSNSPFFATILWPAALFAGALTLVREMIKDLEDMPGDEAAGLNTAPLRWGKGPLLRAVRLLTVVVFLGLPLPALAGLYPVWSAPALLVLAGLPLLLSLRAQFSPDGLHRAQSLVKLAMAGGIAVLLFV